MPSALSSILTTALLAGQPPAPAERVEVVPVVEDEAPEVTQPQASEDGDEAPASDAEARPIEGENEETEKEKKKKKKLRYSFEARAVAGVELKDEAAARGEEGELLGPRERSAEFQLRQARLGLEGHYLDVLDVNLSIELSGLLEDDDEVLRNAYADVKIHDAFRIRAGNFKRPSSRLELRGVTKIPFAGRGLFNDFGVEDLNWADRGIGGQLWGKLKPKRPGLHSIRWFLSATNDLVGDAPAGVDLHARLRYEPTRWLGLAFGGAYKRVADPGADEDSCLARWRRPSGCRRDVFGASGDLVFEVEGLYASVEGNLAQDWSVVDPVSGAARSPWTGGLLGYASYEFELPKKFALQPVVYGEIIDTNFDFAQSEAARAVIGLNLIWTKHLRLMTQVELIEPLAPVTAFNQFVQSRNFGLWLWVML